MFRRWDNFTKKTKESDLKLTDGSRVGVVGGGPAGSFFSYFLLEIARRVGRNIHVDIYEPRNFELPGPAGCNMCGGIISESLVQNLAAEGIVLPPFVVQRGIDSYVLHMDVGKVRIDTPLHEKRIAAVYRGSGPRGPGQLKVRGLDGYLLGLAVSKGAHQVRDRMERVEWENGVPRVKTQGGVLQTYDLLVMAAGVNTGALKVLDELRVGYKSPVTTKTYICELLLGQNTVEQYFGSSMHVFLLSIPRLDFAALIPKGDYVTLCLLGREIKKSLIQSFLNAPEVKRCFPPDWTMPSDPCHCSPWINIKSAVQPFADRIVFVGDSGVTRLYKDGIGAAYKTAKAAALTSVFEGISSEDFRRHYWPVCKRISMDNRFGRLIFGVTRQIRRSRYARKVVLRTVEQEQRGDEIWKPLSVILWDTFTGSAPYRSVLMHGLQPKFLGRLIRNVVSGIRPMSLVRS